MSKLSEFERSCQKTFFNIFFAILAKVSGRICFAKIKCQLNHSRKLEGKKEMDTVRTCMKNKSAYFYHIMLISVANKNVKIDHLSVICHYWIHARFIPFIL